MKKTTKNADQHSFENQVQKNTKKIPFWSTLMGFAKGEYRRLVFAAVASILTGVTVAVQPLIIKYIVDNGISNTAVPPEERLKIAAFYCLIMWWPPCFV